MATLHEMFQNKTRNDLNSLLRDVWAKLKTAKDSSHKESGLRRIKEANAALSRQQVDLASSLINEAKFHAQFV